MSDPADPEPRHAGTAERVYANDAIEVTWEPGLCIHVGACVRASARAFDPQRRPWIDVDAEPPERLLTIVDQCPTGALHARLLNAQSSQESPTVDLQTRRNGPLFVRGPIRITDRFGNVVREDNRMALCRCGASGNKPFCDGSHRRIGFTAE